MSKVNRRKRGEKKKKEKNEGEKRKEEKKEEKKKERDAGKSAEVESVVELVVSREEPVDACTSKESKHQQNKRAASENKYERRRIRADRSARAAEALGRSRCAVQCKCIDAPHERNCDRSRRMATKVAAPDGGYGWAVLFAAVMINMLLPGSVKSFGVLYVEFLKVLRARPTEASWIPALCYFLYNSLGPVSSVLSSKFSYKLVAMVGCIVSSAGLMLSYFADSVAYLYVSYGVMMGIGCGLSFPVTIYIVCEYFERRRGFATGLCICGSAIGTIVLPPLLQFLLDRLGHKLAVLILGGILTSTILCAFLFDPVERHAKLVALDDEAEKTSVSASKEPAALADTSRRGSIATVESLTLDPRRMSLSLQQVHQRQSFLAKQTCKSESARRLEPKPQPCVAVVGALEQEPQEVAATPASNGRAEELEAEPAPAPRGFFDLAILKDPLYLVILVSNSAAGISNTNFMILLPAYAVAEGHSQESAALLLSIVSLLDLIGRVGGASLTDIDLLPKHYYFVAGLALSGLALVLLPLLDAAYLYLACLVAVCGFASGLYIGTTAVIMADMLGPERLASSYGISLFVNGLLQLAGPPICNAAFERIGSYRPIFLTLGMIVLCGTSLWALLPLLQSKRKNSPKLDARSQLDEQA